MRRYNLGKALAVSLALWAASGWAGAADETGGPWIGIEVTQIPEMLSAHLQLGDGGLLITNVAAGSPAEKAGLRRYDVISHLNEEAVSNSVRNFIDQVGAMRTGQEISLTVISKGQPRKVKMRLGTRPAGPIEWLYEASPPEREDVLDVRPPRIFEWMEDKLVPRGPEDLPQKLRELLKRLPADKWGGMKSFLANQGSFFTLTHVSNGKMVQITQYPNGKIVVVRGDAEGNDEKNETKTYGSVEELAKQDPEAHKLLSEAKARQKVPAWDWGADFGFGGKVGRFRRDAKAFKEFWQRQQKELDEMMKGWPDQFDFDLDQLDQLDFDRDKWINRPEEALKEARQRLKRLRQRLERLGVGRRHPSTEPDRSSPRTQINVEPDGSIEIQTTTDGQTLTVHVKNEQELAEKYPKLHEQYKRLKGNLK